MHPPLSGITAESPWFLLDAWKGAFSFLVAAFLLPTSNPEPRLEPVIGSGDWGRKMFTRRHLSGPLGT